LALEQPREAPVRQQAPRRPPPPSSPMLERVLFSLIGLTVGVLISYLLVMWLGGPKKAPNVGQRATIQRLLGDVTKLRDDSEALALKVQATGQRIETAKETIEALRSERDDLRLDLQKFMADREAGDAGQPAEDAEIDAADTAGEEAKAVPADKDVGDKATVAPDSP
jgi:hypothetical protein